MMLEDQQLTFAPPEGAYTVATKLHIPVPYVSSSSQQGVGNNDSSGNAGSSSAESFPFPIHHNSYTSSFDAISISFPSPSSKGKSKESNSSSTSDPSTSNLQQQQQSTDHHSHDGSSSSGSHVEYLGDPNSTGPGSGPGQSPTTTTGAGATTTTSATLTATSPISTTKRRPLVSFSSLPGLSNAPSASKPKNAFKNSTSTFIKSAENIPLASNTSKLRGWDSGQSTWLVWAASKCVSWAEQITPDPSISNSNNSSSSSSNNPTTANNSNNSGFGNNINSNSNSNPSAKNKELISRIHFSTHATALSINKVTASHEKLDIIVGFSTGDILWFDPFCARYTRFNKAGCVTNSFITSLQWYPGSDSCFISAHSDGCILLWDKDREDPALYTPNPVPASFAKVECFAPDEFDENNQHYHHHHHHQQGKSSSTPQDSNTAKTIGDIVVTKTKLDKKGTKYNPMSHWRVSNNAITGFSLSPDIQFCAVTSDDGLLRIIDTSEERLLDAYESYYGSYTTVSWSPDGRFVLTGSQDDLVTVFAPFEGRVVARCPGHSSFLTHVAFDPWRCDGRLDRFASVGEDCKLILWDLSSASLHRPKLRHPYMRRVSVGSSLSLVRRRTIESTANLPLSEGITRHEKPILHPAPLKGQVPVLQPVTIKTVSKDLIACIKFLQDNVIIYTRNGQITIWNRPLDDRTARLFSTTATPSQQQQPQQDEDKQDKQKQQQGQELPQKKGLGMSLWSRSTTNKV